MLMLFAGSISMTAGTCQALIAFFPLVMVTLIVERRGGISMNIRKLPWFRSFAVYVLGFAFVGLGLVLVGSQVGGLAAGWAVWAWLVVAFEVVGLAIVLLASMASTEAQEDGPSAPTDAA